MRRERIAVAVRNRRRERVSGLRDDPRGRLLGLIARVVVDGWAYLGLVLPIGLDAEAEEEDWRRRLYVFIRWQNSAFAETPPCYDACMMPGGAPMPAPGAPLPVPGGPTPVSNVETASCSSAAANLERARA